MNQSCRHDSGLDNSWSWLYHEGILDAMSYPDSLLLSRYCLLNALLASNRHGDGHGLIKRVLSVQE